MPSILNYFLFEYLINFFLLLITNWNWICFFQIPLFKNDNFKKSLKKYDLQVFIKSTIYDEVVQITHTHIYHICLNRTRASFWDFLFGNKLYILLAIKSVYDKNEYVRKFLGLDFPTWDLRNTHYFVVTHIS